MAPLGGGTTAYLLNHIALPPDLPHGNDYDISHEQSLLDLVQQGLEDLESRVVHGEDTAVRVAIAMIKSLIRIRDVNGFVNETELKDSLDKLAHGKGRGIIALEIKSQNAGLLIRRDGDFIVFEAFELSPTNQGAMSGKGRLRRKFPGLASKVSISTMSEEGLTLALASTIARMSSQAVADLQHSNRANTADPSLICDFLMNVVAAIGKPADTIRIVKHTRDEILSLKAAQLPWRRSSLWLLIRVALQLAFTHEAGAMSKGNELYKASIIMVLSRLLGLVKGKWQTLGTDSVYALCMKLVQRLRKIGGVGELHALCSGWQEQVRTNLSSVHDLMASTWNEAVNTGNANIDGTSLMQLQPANDLDIILPMLDEYLRLSAPTAATPEHAFRPTTSFPSFPADKVPSNISGPDATQVLRLYAVEH